MNILVHNFLLAIAYITGAMLCQTFALDQGNITPIWVSFGIAFIWVYVKGFSVLPGIFFGAFFYNLLVSFFQTHPPISSALLAAFMNGTGDMLSMATGVYLMRKFSGGDSILEHLRSASVFIAGAAVLGSLISASFGVTGMWLAGMIPSEFYLSVFTTWTMVDIMGIVVLVPILESIIVRKLNSEFSDRNEEIETMIFLALSALLMYIAITSYGQFASLVAACALVPVLTIYSVRHREFVVTTAAFFLGAYTLAIITLFTPSELADVSLYIHSVQVGLFAIISAMLLIASSVNNINGLNEKVNQQRSRFLANMSHEIRTPMAGVLGLTDMVLKTELSPKQEELIKNIQSSGEMLRQVINDILDQSKLQAGKMEVNEIAFELSSVAETTVSMFGPTAEKQGTILSFDIEAKLPKFVVGDPIRIRQILFNLTSNAIKFTQNGAVEISIERKNEFVRFEVSDTGIGIDENNQKTLFQPFEQLNQDLNREHGGTGLGLSICQSMVEVMGGEIGADNNPGEGSTFWFTLNLPATNNGVGNPSSEQQTTSNIGENLRILIAEDNPINQMILESLLEDEGHFCTTTDNGEEALEAFNASDFDLILTDIRMPKMDGVELLKQIRNSARPTRNTPMIAITADVSEDNAAIYRDAGFNALAYKPVDPIGLLAQIESAMLKGSRRT